MTGNGSTVTTPTTTGRKVSVRAGLQTQTTKKIIADILPIEMKEIDVEVEGMSDLIVHQFDDKSQTELGEKAEGKARAKRAPQDPVGEYLRACYIDEKGRHCAKAIWFKKAMAAVTRFVEGVASKDISGAVFVMGTLIPLKYDGVTVRHVNKDLRINRTYRNMPIVGRDMVRIGKFPNRVPMNRYRPYYRNWSCKLKIQFDASVISAEQIVNLLNRAGFSSGVGDWRPMGSQSSGEFGRFRVK